MRIDSHQHFWKYDSAKHDWITSEMAVIRRDFQPDDLRPLLQTAGIDGCITVQVDQNIKETLVLLRHADQNPFIKGVVGWIDFRGKEVHERLSYFTQYKKLKGFRHIVQAEPEGFLRQTAFLAGIQSLNEFNFTYDLLVYPHQLEEAIKFVGRFPEQKFVLDHLAKPSIRDKKLEPWRSQIKRLAAAGHIWCKFSGMITEADWKTWKPDDFFPYMEIILEAFGADRILYGSDWPVCLVAGSYPTQLGIVETFIDRLSPTEKQQIMGKNAIQFYNL